MPTYGHPDGSDLLSRPQSFTPYIISSTFTRTTFPTFRCGTDCSEPTGTRLNLRFDVASRPELKRSSVRCLRSRMCTTKKPKIRRIEHCLRKQPLHSSKGQ